MKIFLLISFISIYIIFSFLHFYFTFIINCNLAITLFSLRVFFFFFFFLKTKVFKFSITGPKTFHKSVFLSYISIFKSFIFRQNTELWFQDVDHTQSRLQGEDRGEEQGADSSGALHHRLCQYDDEEQPSLWQPEPPLFLLSTQPPSKQSQTYSRWAGRRRVILSEIGQQKMTRSTWWITEVERLL